MFGDELRGRLSRSQLVFGISNAASLRTAGSAILPVIAIRVSASMPSGGTITNRETVIPANYRVFSEDAPVYCEVLYNPSLSGGSWTAVNSTHSGVDVNRGATAAAGGLVIDSVYIPANTGPGGTERLLGVGEGELLSELVMSQNASATQGDVLAITAQRVGGMDSDVGVALTWRELY